MSEINQAVARRQRIEKRIVRKIVRRGIELGYKFNIDNGGDDYELPNESDDASLILKNCFATDEEYLVAFKDGFRAGSVFLVYGNDGWDVINDNSVKIKEILSEAQKYIDQIS